MKTMHPSRRGSGARATIAELKPAAAQPGLRRQGAVAHATMASAMAAGAALAPLSKHRAGSGATAKVSD